MILATILAICAVPILAENEEISKRRVWSQLRPNERQDIVELHNKERQAIGGSNVMEITWDDDLASWAQQYADKCVIDEDGLAAHGDTELPDGREVGQNLVWGDETNLLKKAEGWANEKKIYNVRTGRCNRGWKKCAHYSQMVWHSTNKIGCGFANCPGLGNHLVCDYYPGGNERVPGTMVFKPPASFGAPCSGCNLDPGTACDNGLCKPCNPSGDRSCKKYDTAACKDRTDKSNIDCSYMKRAGLCDDPKYNVKEYCAKSCGACRS